MILKQRLKAVFLGLLFFSQAPFASEAQKAFETHDFQKAQTLWVGQIKTHPHNPNLYYNVAKSYEKQQKLGFARAYYLKALALDPADIQSKSNLQNIEKKLIDQELINQDFIESLLKILTFNRTHSEIAWFFLIFFSLFSISLWLPSSLAKKSRWALFILSLISASILYCAYFQSFIAKKSIIITPKTAVHSGPSESLPTLFFIHEGSQVYPLKKKNNWQKITLKNGLEGWIKNNDIFTL